MTEHDLLTARDLAVGYGGRAVAEGLNFSAKAGEILGVIGPNGVGKTTLLRTLSRALPPIGGEVLLLDRPLRAYGERELARELALLLTGRPQPERMRCEELVSLGRYPYTGRLGILSAEDRRAVEETMALVGVTELRDRDFTQLSDGQRQRVLLGRALCQEPRVLLLDEPGSFLDLGRKLRFMALLKRLAKERGIAAVMTMHELALARRYADRVLCLRDGRQDRLGSAEEVFEPAYIEALFELDPGTAELFL